jgi:hypothetical protein
MDEILVLVNQSKSKDILDCCHSCASGTPTICGAVDKEK